MAGLGRKLFTRQTLASADVQNYLMDQAVMRFASAAARAAAIPGPTEGMVTYLDDAKAMFVYTTNPAGQYVWDRVPQVGVGWVEIMNNVSYDYIPGASWGELPGAGADVVIPAGRTCDVELTVPKVNVLTSGTVALRIMAGSVIVDLAEHTVGPYGGAVFAAKLTGSVGGSGTAVRLAAQGLVIGGGGRVQASGAGVRLRYRVV